MSNAPYPDPHVPVDDYTDVHVGDVFRYVVKTRRGDPVDLNDYFVTEIETEPRDFVDGKPLTFQCWRLYVTILTPPAEGAVSRTIGDVQVCGESTRIVDSSDELVRADRRHTVALSSFVATQSAEASR